MTRLSLSEPADLGRFDLNLLVVFDAVLRERSVTRAAERLCLSQPAVSHALNRLRQLLDDRLFVRGPVGMEPTPRALQLSAVLQRTLEDLRHAIQPLGFDPGASQRTFRIAVNNYAAAVVAPAVIGACRKAAPGVRLAIRPSGSMDVEGALERGELDLAVTARSLGSSRITSHTLFMDDYVALTRREHPGVPGPLTLEAFAELPRVTVSSSGDDTNFLDKALDTAGLRQEVVADAPYLSLAVLLATSDMVALLARRFAEAVAAKPAMMISDLLFPTPSVPCVISWRRHLEDDPSHIWLRGMVAKAAPDERY
ncbi:MAG: LysR family transcriptional regulator [Caulobacteraceae bacterium]|nr:LysR family transcriptional regulator [Caulobacteraceae bacterium]